MSEQVRPRRGRRGPESLKVATASRAVPLVAGYGLSLASTPVVASSLGLAQFGVWALTGAVAQYGALLDLGVSRSVTRFTALSAAQDDDAGADRTLATAAALVVGVGAVLAVLAAAFAGPLAGLTHEVDVAQMRWVLAATVVVLVSGQLTTAVTGSSYGREVQTLPNLVATFANASNTVASTAVAFVTHSLVAYAVTIAVMSCVSLVVLAVLVHLRVAPLRPARPSWAHLRELTSFGLKGQSVVLSEIMIFQLAKVLLGVASGPEAVGAYELGSRLALGFRTAGAIFVGALTAPLTVVFARRGVPGVAEEADRLTASLVAVSIMSPLVGLALAPAFLEAWLGSYLPLTLATLSLLCLAFGANLFTSVQGVAAEAVGRPGLNARSAVLTAVVSTALGVPMLWLVGPVAMVAGTAVAVVLGSLYAVRVIQPALGATSRAFYARAAGPLLLGVAAVLVSRLSILWLLGGGRWSALLALVVGGLVFAAAYVPAAVRLGFVPRAWLVALWARLMPRRPPARPRTRSWRGR